MKRANDSTSKQPQKKRRVGLRLLCRDEWSIVFSFLSFDVLGIVGDTEFERTELIDLFMETCHVDAQSLLAMIKTRKKNLLTLLEKTHPLTYEKHFHDLVSQFNTGTVPFLKTDAENVHACLSDRSLKYMYDMWAHLKTISPFAIYSAAIMVWIRKYKRFALIKRYFYLSPSYNITEGSLLMIDAYNAGHNVNCMLHNGSPLIVQAVLLAMKSGCISDLKKFLSVLNQAPCNLYVTLQSPTEKYYISVMEGIIVAALTMSAEIVDTLLEFDMFKTDNALELWKHASSLLCNTKHLDRMSTTYNLKMSNRERILNYTSFFFYRLKRWILNEKLDLSFEMLH